MSDPNLHLKLDRLLAGIDKVQTCLIAQDETTDVLIETMTKIALALDTQTEAIDRLAQAMNQPSGSGDLGDSLKSIAVSLKQIKEDGSKVPVMLGRLVQDIGQATQDAVILAMGGGIAASGEGAPT